MTGEWRAYRWLAACVADEPGDLLDSDVAAGHEADEGKRQLSGDGKATAPPLARSWKSNLLKPDRRAATLAGCQPSMHLSLSATFLSLCGLLPLRSGGS